MRLDRRAHHARHRDRLARDRLRRRHVAHDGLACGLLPAFRGTRVPVSESLKLQSRAVGLVSRRTLLAGRALVAAQMAFCLLLLIVAGLFVRSLRVLATSDIGFDRQHVLGARLDVRGLGYSAEQRQALYRAPHRSRASRCRACESVSLSQNGPVVGLGADQRLQRRRVHAANGRAHVDQRGVRHRELLLDRRLEGSARPAVRPGRSRRRVESHADQRNDGAPFLRRPGPGWQALGIRRQRGQHADAFVIIGVVEDAKYRDLRAAVPTMTYHLSGPSEDADP